MRLLFVFSPRPEIPVWTPERNSAHAEQLKADAELRAQALQEHEPSLCRVPLTRADLDALTDDDEVDDDAPMGDLLARAARHIVLCGTWAGGTLRLRLHDALLEAELRLADGADALARAELPGLLERLAQGCGWPLAGHPDRPPPTASQVAEEAWLHEARLVQHLRRRERRERRLKGAGPASALLLSAGAWALALLLLHDGIETGTLAARADLAHSADFTVESLEGRARGPYLEPRYRLAGIVSHSVGPATLEVLREAYLRAAPGARYTVVATGDPQRPILLESDAQPPLLRGDGWGMSGTTLAALLPLGLWGFFVARPIAVRRTPEMWKQMTRRTVGLLAIAAVMAWVWW